MKNPIFIPELRRLLAQGDKQGLRDICAAVHPAEVAEFIGPLEPEEVWAVLHATEIHLRAQIFENLEIDIQKRLVETISNEEVADLLESMSHDDRADLFQELEPELAEEIFPLMARAERADILRLSSYEEGTAGAVMTTDYALLPMECTVGEALQKLRREAPDRETIYYIYVVDDNRFLKGFVSLKGVILARSHRKISDIMKTEVIFATVDEDQEEVADKIAKYDLLAIPVVAGEGTLVGVVTVDDVVDVIEEEATEDIYHLGAVGTHLDYLKSGIFQLARQRVPWLLILVAIGIVSAIVIREYEDLLKSCTFLSCYLIVLNASGGNAGSQTATVVIRGLATGELDLSNVFQILWKEVRIALLVSLAMAGLVALSAILFFKRDYSLAYTVALAMICTVVLAKCLGTVLPLFFKRIGLDPALMSTPLIATVLDIATLIIYFTFATMIF